jgi:hypothetical protein
MACDADFRSSNFLSIPIRDGLLHSAQAFQNEPVVSSGLRAAIKNQPVEKLVGFERSGFVMLN